MKKPITISAAAIERTPSLARLRPQDLRKSRLNNRKKAYVSGASADYFLSKDGLYSGLADENPLPAEIVDSFHESLDSE